MTNLLAAFTAVTLYLCCTVLLMMKLRQSAKVATLNKQTILVPGFLGLGAHLYTLSISMMSPIGINIGFFTALSLVSAFITLFTLVSAIRHPIEILGIVVMPVAAFTMAADLATGYGLVTISKNDLLVIFQSKFFAHPTALLFIPCLTDLLLIIDKILFTNSCCSSVDKLSK